MSVYIFIAYWFSFHIIRFCWLNLINLLKMQSKETDGSFFGSISPSISLPSNLHMEWLSLSAVLTRPQKLQLSTKFVQNLEASLESLQKTLVLFLKIFRANILAVAWHKYWFQANTEHWIETFILLFLCTQRKWKNINKNLVKISFVNKYSRLIQSKSLQSWCLINQGPEQ